MTTTIDDIKAAAQRLENSVVKTPVLTSPELDARVNGHVLMKAEPLQRTGSFKIRGAYNRLSRLNDNQRRAGVVAFSSGNHAQGVACAAQILDVPATIVMPYDAPSIKVANTRSYGADIIFYDRVKESREAIAETLAEEKGAVLVPSYNDPYIIAGQGTVGLEISEYARARALDLDDVLICLGGGGLASGSAIAVHDIFPKCRIWGVEPEGYDDARQSLEKGEIIGLAHYPPTLCDALQTPAVGPLTFAILQDHLEGVFCVTDEDVRAAMRFAFHHLKIIVEPGGAVALAAVLAGKVNLKGKTAALVLSGGNVDPNIYAGIIRE